MLKDHDIRSLNLFILILILEWLISSCDGGGGNKTRKRASQTVHLEEQATKACPDKESSNQQEPQKEYGLSEAQDDCEPRTKNSPLEENNSDNELLADKNPSDIKNSESKPDQIDTASTKTFPGIGGTVEGPKSQDSLTPLEKDIAENFVKTATSPIFKAAGNDNHDNMIDNLLSGHGLGFGLSVSGSAGAGVKNFGGAFTLELVNHRGEIGLFCAPGVNFGLSSAGAGVNVSASGTLIKTLGCTDTGSYEGGFLGFGVNVGWQELGRFSLSGTASIGVDPGGMIEFGKNFKSFKVGQEELKNELEKLDTQFIKYLETSEDPIEIISFYIFLKIFNAMVSILHGPGFNPGLIEVLERVSKLMVTFKKDNVYYPSVKRVFGNLLNLLTPRSDFPLSVHILVGFSSFLTGCDSLSGSISVGASAAANPIEVTGSISYSHYINPERNSDKKTKVRLDDIKSMFSSPEGVAKFFESGSQQVGENVKDTAKRIENLFNSGLFLTGESSDAGDRIGRFSANSLRIVDPVYLAEQCILGPAEDVIETGSSFIELITEAGKGN